MLQLIHELQSAYGEANKLLHTLCYNLRVFDFVNFRNILKNDMTIIS